MIQHEPVEIQSRHRIYTTRSQRRRLGIQGKGRGTKLDVGLVTQRRASPGESCDGQCHQYGRYATTTVWLLRDGEFRVPKAVRSYLGIDPGDIVLLTVTKD